MVLKKVLDDTGKIVVIETGTPLPSRDHFTIMDSPSHRAKTNEVIKDKFGNVISTGTFVDDERKTPGDTPYVGPNKMLDSTIFSQSRKSKPIIKQYFKRPVESDDVDIVRNMTRDMVSTRNTVMRGKSARPQGKRSRNYGWDLNLGLDW